MNMKLKFLTIPVMSAALVIAPASLRADDADYKKGKAEEKISEAKNKTHEKICQGNHGTVTAKTDNSVTIDGKTYALTADTRVNKQEEPILLKTVKVGDHLCFTTEKAADGSRQISQLMAVDKDDKVRVRDRDNESPNKIEVETPNKKIEVK